MKSLIKNTIMEFFISDFWQDNFGKILTTFGFSVVGTGAKAVSMSEPIKTLNPTTFINLSQMTLVDIFQIGSYTVSMLVGITVIWRFAIFLKEKSKPQKNKK